MDCVLARIVSISVKMILHRLVDVDLATVLSVTVAALVCICVYVRVYIDINSVYQKRMVYNVGYNFAKCQPIFKIHSLLERG